MNEPKFQCPTVKSNPILMSIYDIFKATMRINSRVKFLSLDKNKKLSQQYLTLMTHYMVQNP